MMAKRFAVTIGVVAFALAGSYGCRKVGQEVIREVAQAASPAVKPQELKPPTEQEATAFGEAMQKAVDAGDPAAIERLIDFPLLLDRALAGAHLPKNTVAETAKGVAAGARQTGLVAQLASLPAAKVGFALLSSRLDSRGRWVSFRSLPSAGGFEHYEFLLTQRDDKSVAAANVFFLSSSELMSTSMHHLLIGAFAEADKSFLERLSAQENLFVKHLADISRIRQAQASGQSEEALALLDKLPDSSRTKSSRC